MAIKYRYTRILVSNFKACFKFYRDVMGYPVSWGDENGTYASFSTGEVILAIFDRWEMSKTVGTSHLPAAAEEQDRVCLIFEVDDVDKAYQRLRNEGIKFTTQPTDHPDWGIRAAHFRDPDGNLLEIYHDLPAV